MNRYKMVAKDMDSPVENKLFFINTASPIHVPEESISHSFVTALLALI
jgi:hypothetical protein